MITDAQALFQFVAKYNPLVTDLYYRTEGLDLVAMDLIARHEKPDAQYGSSCHRAPGRFTNHRAGSGRNRVMGDAPSLESFSSLSPSRAEANFGRCHPGKCASSAIYRIERSDSSDPIQATFQCNDVKNR